MNISKSQMNALRQIEPGHTTENEIRRTTLVALMLNNLVERQRRGYITITQAGLDILYPPSTLTIPNMSLVPGIWKVVIGRNGGVRGSLTLHGTTFTFGYLWRDGHPVIGMDTLNTEVPSSIYDLLATYPGE